MLVNKFKNSLWIIFKWYWCRSMGGGRDESSHLGRDTTSTGSNNPLICTYTAMKTSHLTKLIQMPSNYNYYTEIPNNPYWNTSLKECCINATFYLIVITWDGTQFAYGHFFETSSWSCWRYCWSCCSRMGSDPFTHVYTTSIGTFWHSLLCNDFPTMLSLNELKTVSYSSWLHVIHTYRKILWH
jgi:hypothetical protein